VSIRSNIIPFPARSRVPAQAGMGDLVGDIGCAAAQAEAAIKGALLGFVVGVVAGFVMGMKR